MYENIAECNTINYIKKNEISYCFNRHYFSSHDQHVWSWTQISRFHTQLWYNTMYSLASVWIWEHKCRINLVEILVSSTYFYRADCLSQMPLDFIVTNLICTINHLYFIILLHVTRREPKAFNNHTPGGSTYSYQGTETNIFSNLSSWTNMHARRTTPERILLHLWNGQSRNQENVCWMVGRMTGKSLPHNCPFLKGTNDGFCSKTCLATVLIRSIFAREKLHERFSASAVFPAQNRTN